MAKLLFEKDAIMNVRIDADAPEGIKKIWKKVAGDIATVTGVECVEGQHHQAHTEIIITMAGDSDLYSTLCEYIPGLAGIRGQWETYGFYLEKECLPEQKSVLVIAGSDLLGTIYGMFHLSELFGVTAMNYWGDQIPVRYEKLLLVTEEDDPESDVHVVTIKNGNSREPSVKYRGFFINDEWPCFGNWTFSHFGGFTAEMYDHVFEYLLRMKGNYLWPAMWTSSFLLDGPGMASMELADQYGIYIGMSHHEPCMRSSEEWDLCKGEKSGYGTAWDYGSNAEGLKKYWKDGLLRAKGHNVFPTIGMRGERDSKMLGDDAAIAENVRILKEIITEQKKLIRETLEDDQNIEQPTKQQSDATGQKTPLLFAVYKEVEDYYFGDGTGEGIRGFEELDDVTLLLCEDNFGNMRALPQEDEPKRQAGFGMYFHLDYHGGPVSYEWVNSTPLTKIWEQMTECYEHGVRDLWIVNVGDLKFQEYPLGYFMELAYDQETLGVGKASAIPAYTGAWVRKQFGGIPSLSTEIGWVLDETARLNGLRRPESLNPHVYHPAYDGEWDTLMQACEKLDAVNEQLMSMLTKAGFGDMYYSLVYFPAAASSNLIRMHLYAAKNRLYAVQGKAAANFYGAKLRAAIAKDQKLAQDFAAYKDGKWSGMEKAFHIGFTNWNSEDWRYPVCHTVYLPETPRLVVSRADDEKTFTNQYFPQPLVIDDFCYPGTDTVVLQVANGGQGSLDWHVVCDCPYLHWERREGLLETETELLLTLDREAMYQTVREKATDTQTDGDKKLRKTTAVITAGEEKVPLVILVRDQSDSQLEQGTILGVRHRYVWDAADAQQTAAMKGFEKLANYGKYGSGMKAFPTTASYPDFDGPSLTYALYVEEPGEYLLEIHTSPANPLVYGGTLQLGVQVGTGEIRRVSMIPEDFHGGDNDCAAWERDILLGEHVQTLPVTIGQTMEKNDSRTEESQTASGQTEESQTANGQTEDSRTADGGCRETITVYAGDAGLVLERFVLRRASDEVRPSFFGPKKSPRHGSSVSFS